MRWPSCGRGYSLKANKVSAEEAVADQINAAPMLTYGVEVVAGVVAGHTDQSGSAPEHLGRDGRPELVTDQVLELAAVIYQPAQIEEPLVDHTRIRAALVLDHDGRPVRVEPQRIDSAGVNRARAVFGCQDRTPNNASVSVSTRRCTSASAVASRGASSLTPLPMVWNNRSSDTSPFRGRLQHMKLQAYFQPVVPLRSVLDRRGRQTRRGRWGSGARTAESRPSDRTVTPAGRAAFCC